VLINECLAASREYDETKTRSGGLERILELCSIVRRYTGNELTPGTLYYLLGTLLAAGAGGAAEGLHESLAGGLHCIEKRWLAEFGSHDGFPAVGDPQDQLYLSPCGEVGAPDALPTISVGGAARDESARPRRGLGRRVWRYVRERLVPPGRRAAG